MKDKNINDIEKLFDPNKNFDGDVDKVLQDYPNRSSHLEEYVKDKKGCKQLNTKFIKDGYMYLLRGSNAKQETGFYSKLYSSKRTIETEKLDVDNVAYAQQLNGNTPFISTTTSLSVASAFSNEGRIYVVKVPVFDVYYFCEIDGLYEKEYLIPDFIKQEEIIRSFRHDKFKQIYNFLTNEIGLELTPEDLEETTETINRPDKEKIQMIRDFNEGSSQLDDILIEIQEELMKSKMDDNRNTRPTDSKQIAVFTDVHGLYEPLEAILKDIEKRGIKEIYSLGDNIGLGPNPKEVLDLLDEYNVLSIAGNAEEYINLSSAPFNYFDYEKELNTAWTEKQLTEEQITKLKMYPKFIELTVGKKQIALCHFANDIRCDYDKHSTWSYQDYPNESYDQFFYTNSDEQLDELSMYINYPYNSKFQKAKTIEKLQMLREYIEDKEDIADYLKGITSYIHDPLFLSNHTLKTVDDYDAIIQGHVHFESDVETSKTNFHTLRAVGMGNKHGREDLAAYTIIHETDTGYSLEKVEVPYDKEKTERVIRNTHFPKRVISAYLKVKNKNML